MAKRTNLESKGGLMEPVDMSQQFVVSTNSDICSCIDDAVGMMGHNNEQCSTRSIF